MRTIECTLRKTERNPNVIIYVEFGFILGTASLRIDGSWDGQCVSATWRVNIPLCLRPVAHDSERTDVGNVLGIGMRSWMRIVSIDVRIECVTIQSSLLGMQIRFVHKHERYRILSHVHQYSRTEFPDGFTRIHRRIMNICTTAKQYHFCSTKAYYISTQIQEPLHN